MSTHRKIEAIGRRAAKGSHMVSTSEEVARAAGVSRATVSMILNGRGNRFAAPTRARVEQAAAELGYQPSIAGRALANGASDIVISLIPNTTFGANFQLIYELLTRELETRGLTLMLRMAPDDEESLGRLLARIRPKAVVSFTSFSEADRSLLEARGVRAIDPTLLSGQDHPNRRLARVQAEHLVSRGYDRLAFAHLQDARQDVFGAEREQGVRDVAREHSLQEPISLRLDVDIEQAISALRSISQRNVGIVCYNDDVATALLSAARELGLNVPEDFGLIGMDDTPLAALTHPPLSTVRLDLVDAAHAAVANVLHELGLQPEQSNEQMSHRSIALIERGSVRTASKSRL